MRIVWRRREHLCTRCTAEDVKVNIREVWKTRQILLYILYLCFWKRRWSYGASTFEMFENFRKISIDFRTFWKISYELLSIPTYFEVSRDWAIDFVVAAGAGWDEFSKRNKRRASDAKVCRSCRFWKMLKTDDFVPKIGVDTAENELRKEWRVVETLWLSAEQARRKETKGTAELIRFL